MSEKVRTAVLVSGGGTNLQALLDAEKRGEINHGKIVLVVSNNRNAYALERAAKFGVKTEVVVKKEIGTQEDFENKLAEVLEEYKIEFVILAGFMSILGEKFIKKFNNRIINVHPSLIPSFCGKGYYGLKVHEAALNYGVKVTGATVHFVNEIPDGGKIILQKAVEISDNDTPETLQKKVMEQAEWKILPLAYEQVCKKISEDKK